MNRIMITLDPDDGSIDSITTDIPGIVTFISDSYNDAEQFPNILVKPEELDLLLLAPPLDD